jgi:WD40 repeat protein/DNA-binding SARP family transcriptional activator
MARLVLSLLGGFAAFLDGNPLSGLKTDKARALLIYLAVERSRPHRRQALAGLLWPDYLEEGARANLRHALANLRQVLEEDQNEIPFLVVEGETLQLNPECDCHVDVAEFEKLAAGTGGSDLEDAVSLYRGAFLEGFTLKGSPDFDNWTAILRERYLQTVSQALGRLGEMAAQDKAYEKAIACARRRLAFEPWQEDAHQQLMRFLALIGQRASALAQYEACCQVLKDELGARPTAETVHLFEDIRAGKIGPASHTEAPLEAANPYKGLRAFQEADADDFYGRAALVDHLLSCLASPASASPNQGEHRFLAVVGPSGSGKTSLIKAGLIPALRRGEIPGSDKWPILEMVPGEHPLEELEVGLLRLSGKALPGLMEQIQRDERGLLRAVRLVLPDDDSELLLVVDQFEEAFTLGQEKAEIAHFLDSLAAAVEDPHSHLRLVIGLRADFYDRPLLHPRLGSLMQRRTEVVLPMSAEELTSAIQKPAEKVGIVFEEGLVAAIVADIIDQPGSLPLLQYALTELFELRQGDRITYQAYRSLGGLLGVLGRRADEVYADLEEQAKVTARQLFLRLVALGEGTEDTRRRALRSELEALRAASDEGKEFEMEKVIEAFGRVRLLSFDRDPLSRSPTVEVAHEALLREWPRLKAWLDDSRTDLHQQRQLANAAREWRTAGRESSYLLVEQKLAMFETWAKATNLALTQEEDEFLQACLTQREAQAKAEIERKALERRTHLRSQLFSRLLAVVILAAIVGGVSLGYTVLRAQRGTKYAQQTAQSESLSRATQEQRASIETSLRQTQQVEAEQQKQILEQKKQEEELTTANKLITRALQEIGNSDPERAVLLGLEILRIYPNNPQVKNTLEQIIREVYPYYLLNSGFSVFPDQGFSVAWSPDGKTLAQSRDDFVVLWDTETREKLGLIEFTWKGGTRITWSPDGKYIVTGLCRNSFIVQDASDIYCGIPRIIDARSAVNVRIIGGEGITTTNSLDWSPEGKLLISEPDGRAMAYEADSGKLLLTIKTGNISVNDARWSPDGKQILTAAQDGSLGAWDAKSGVELYRMQQSTAPQQMAVSPDGLLLATLDSEGDALVWDLDQRSNRFKVTSSANAAIQALTWSGEGRMLITAGRDGAVRFWDADTGLELFHLLSSSVNLTGISFTPVYNRLAVSNRSNSQVQVWDLSPKTATALPRLEAAMMELGQGLLPYDLAWSPDGTRLAGGGFIWEAASGKKLVRLYDKHARVVYEEGQMLVDPEVAAAGRTFTKTSLPDASGYSAWSPDGRLYADFTFCDPAKGDNQLCATIWDTKTFKIIARLPGGASLGWSPDGTKMVIAAAQENLAHVYDIQTGQELFSVGDGTYRLLFPRWSPDGSFLSSGLKSTDPSSTSHLIIWDGRTGAKLFELPSQDGDASMSAWSPDGKSLAVTYEMGAVKIWDASTWQVKQTFNGHTAKAWAVAWSPDGKWLASSDTSGQVRIWGTADGKEIMSFTMNKSFAWSLHWSPDGTLIAASGGQSLPIIRRAWTSTEDLIAYVKANLVWRELTPAERTEFGLPEKK